MARAGNRLYQGIAYARGETTDLPSKGESALPNPPPPRRSCLRRAPAPDPDQRR